jgi:diadenosine tetraphosphate (Ap4A) HIT family hydrolase
MQTIWRIWVGGIFGRDPVPENSCPFCTPDYAALILETSGCRVLWDSYPVSPGHALIVPKEHIPDWFAAAPELHSELSSLIAATKNEIEQRHQPDGYNVGFNAGVAAGQTIEHLHIHVIPRYKEDIDDPRGGIRWVIPEKAVYWEGE